MDVFRAESIGGDDLSGDLPGAVPLDVCEASEKQIAAQGLRHG
jgi:hypothetical protein